MPRVAGSTKKKDSISKKTGEYTGSYARALVAMGEPLGPFEVTENTTKPRLAGEDIHLQMQPRVGLYPQYATPDDVSMEPTEVHRKLYANWQQPEAELDSRAGYTSPGKISIALEDRPEQGLHMGDFYEAREGQIGSDTTEILDQDLMNRYKEINPNIFQQVQEHEDVHASGIEALLRDTLRQAGFGPKGVYVKGQDFSLTPGNTKANDTGPLPGRWSESLRRMNKEIP